MSNRKLQQECDKLHKKIVEGLQVFDDIYDTIITSDNASQKERLEGELRKEIKKLQRSRDQVKQWLGDSGIKLDKNLLQDSRTKIENAMERFKEVEKVSKMKQFSNEGLEMQTKLGARGLDEAKKNEAGKYITDVLEELGRQNELLGGELSTLTAKKRLGNSQMVIDDLNMKIDRNNMHIGKLEQILHHLENEELEPERIDDIKDDLDYYVENNQAADFVEYNEFYDNLELDEAPQIAPTPSHSSHPEDSPAPSAKETSSLHLPSTNIPQNSTSAPALPQSAPANTSSSHEHSSTPAPAPAPATAAAGSLNRTSNGPSAAAVLANSLNQSHAGSVSSNQTAGNVSPAKPPLTNGPSVSNIGTPKAPPPGLSPQVKSQSPTPQGLAPRSSAEELKKRVVTQAASQTQAAQSPALQTGSHVTSQSTVPQSSGVNGGSVKNGSVLPSPLPVLGLHANGFAEAASRFSTLTQSRLANPLPFHAISQVLETSLVNCPDSADAECPRQYIPVNVHPLSVDYPQEPMYELSSAKIKKFDNDTLFFCFYYSEGQDDLLKYNAAKELSSRGWIFNTETKQWFSKNDKGKNRSMSVVASEEQEEGQSYKYFDYQSSWLIRRKDNYVFKPEFQQTF